MHGAGEEVYGRDAFERKFRGGKFLGVTRKALGIAGHVSEPLGAVWKRKKVCKRFCGSAGHALIGRVDDDLGGGEALGEALFERRREEGFCRLSDKCRLRDTVARCIFAGADNRGLYAFNAKRSAVRTRASRGSERNGADAAVKVESDPQAVRPRRQALFHRAPASAAY